MPSCRCIVQDCSKKANPRIGISSHSPKSNYELAKWKSFVRAHSSNFNPNGIFKIYSVHFSSDCFERTVHKEGAPRRLITGSIPTICIWKPSVESTTSAISARSRRRVSKYRFSFRKLQILISQTTDFHFANYRFPFRKLQISISQTTDFHFVSSHFVSQTTVSRCGFRSKFEQ